MFPITTCEDCEAPLNDSELFFMVGDEYLCPDCFAKRVLSHDAYMGHFGCFDESDAKILADLLGYDWVKASELKEDYR